MSHSARDKGGSKGELAPPDTDASHPHVGTMERSQARPSKAGGWDVTSADGCAARLGQTMGPGWRLVRWQRPLSLAPRVVPLRASVAQQRRMATLAPAATEPPGL